MVLYAITLPIAVIAAIYMVVHLLIRFYWENGKKWRYY